MWGKRFERVGLYQYDEEIQLDNGYNAISINENIRLEYDSKG